MDYQQIASLAIVAVTALLLVLRQIRKHRRAKLRPCGHDCGCAPSVPGYSANITYKIKADATHR